MDASTYVGLVARDVETLPMLYRLHLHPGCLRQERRDPAMSRSDYMERLAKDLKEYYGYLRELVDVFLAASWGCCW